jgi:hypothetical protein
MELVTPRDRRKVDRTTARSWDDVEYDLREMKLNRWMQRKNNDEEWESVIKEGQGY